MALGQKFVLQDRIPSHMNTIELLPTGMMRLAKFLDVTDGTFVSMEYLRLVDDTMSQ